MPPQTLHILNAVDEVDLAQIQVVIPIFFEYEVLVYGEWSYERVVQELGSAKQEGEELIIVESQTPCEPAGSK